MVGSSLAGRATQGGTPEQPRPRGSEAPGIPEPKNIAVMLQKAYLDTLLVPFFAVVGCMRSLVSAPAGVHGRHVDPVQLQLQPARPRQHVQRGFGHVCVRVFAALAHPAKLTFHGRNIHNKLPRAGRALQERGQPGYEEEWGDRVDGEGLEKFGEGNLLQTERPRVGMS